MPLGEPDLAHKLFCIFMLAHLASTLMLILGALWVSNSFYRSPVRIAHCSCICFLQLKPNYMLCYILLTLIKILAMVILVISDVILVIWAPIISFYIVMFCTYSMYIYSIHPLKCPLYSFWCILLVGRLLVLCRTRWQSLYLMTCWRRIEKPKQSRTIERI